MCRVRCSAHVGQLRQLPDCVRQRSVEVVLVEITAKGATRDTQCEWTPGRARKHLGAYIDVSADNRPMLDEIRPT